MLAQTNAITVTNLRLVKKAMVHAERVVVRKVRNVALPQAFNVLARDAHKLWADLLILPTTMTFSARYSKKRASGPDWLASSMITTSKASRPGRMLSATR